MIPFSYCYFCKGDDLNVSIYHVVWGDGDETDSYYTKLCEPCAGRIRSLKHDGIPVNELILQPDDLDCELESPLDDEDLDTSDPDDEPEPWKSG